MTARGFILKLPIIIELSLPRDYPYILHRVHTTSFWNILNQRTSNDGLTEKLVSLVSLAKFVKWQKCKTALCDLREKLLGSNFMGQPNLQIILEAKSMDESS